MISIMIRLLVGLCCALLVACSSEELLHRQEPLCDDLIIPNTKLYNDLLAKNYEVPPVLNAKNFLPQQMLYSSIYSVKDEVYSDGFLDHYQIETPWGRYTAGGTYQLKTRLNELIAIDALKKISSGKAALNGFTGGVEGLIMAPFKAVGLISSMFSSDKKEKNDFDENEIKEFEKYQNRKNIVNTVNLENPRLAKLIEKRGAVEYSAPKVELQGQGMVNSLIGYGKQVSEIQKHFNIDPYSDNDVLRAEIQRVARLQTGGGLSTSMATSSSNALSMLGQVNSAVGAVGAISIYADEATQRKQTRFELLRAGVSDALIEKFQAASGLSVVFRTQITNSLIALKGVAGRDELIKTASMITDYESGQIFLQTCFSLVNLFHQVNYTRFIKDTPLPSVAADSGKVFIVLAADHLYWTENLKDFVEETLDAIIEDGKYSSVEAHITAKVSNRVFQELQKRGVKVVEQADPNKYAL